ncbi:MAG: hypothetical protein F6K54_17905 [Okeania sp. SIO3B5]|nr:hypothetical protein [Okeania sp. SIO3B5]
MITTSITLILTQSSPVKSQLSKGFTLKKMVLANSKAGDVFGYSVAVKGIYGLVGAPFKDAPSQDSGAAYLWDLTTDRQLAKLIPPDSESGEQLGYAVALNQNSALVTAPYRDVNGQDKGAAYLFSLDNIRNRPKQFIVSNLKSEDLFGYAAAMNEKYAVISAAYKDAEGIDSGVVYVFDVNTRKQLHKLIPSDASAGDLFGYTVAIEDDYALIGAPYKDEKGIDSGAIYIFDLETGQQLKKIIPNDGSAGDLFGFAVAVYDYYGLVSAGYDDPNGTDSGSVYLYDLGTGEQVRKIEPNDTQAGDVFGRSVAMTAEYNLIGAGYQDARALDAGSVYLLNDGTLTKLIPSNPEAGDVFGYSVAINEDFALISAPYTDEEGVDSGVVYILDLNQ